MVVPQSRRGFLALIRNAAVAAGLVAANPATIFAENENHNGLPVLELEYPDFRYEGDTLLNFEYIHKFARDITTSKEMIRHGIIQHSVLVWLPKTHHRVDYCNRLGPISCYGEMNLEYRSFKDEKPRPITLTIKNTKNTTIEPLGGDQHRRLNLKKPTSSSV